MKRDMDLIRRLMLDIEKEPAGTQTSGDELLREGDDQAVVAEHLKLLIEQELINGKGYQTLSSLDAAHILIFSITWQGHEFLDAVRNDTVWKKTKDKVASVGGTASVEILTQIAAGFLRQMLGITT